MHLSGVPFLTPSQCCPKEAAQSLTRVAKFSCCPWIQEKERPRAGLWLQPPVFTYTCCFCHAPIAAGLEGVCRQIGNRWWVAKLTRAWKSYSEKTGAPGQSHYLGMGSLDPVARITITTGDCQAAVDDQDFFGCSSDEIFHLSRRESGFACSRADIAQFKLTEGLRPVGYPHLV